VECLVVWVVWAEWVVWVAWECNSIQPKSLKNLNPRNKSFGGFFLAQIKLE
jgi:hypothetical protein